MIKVCKVCGKEFEAWGSQQYCSLTCRKEWDRQRYKKKPKELKKCPICGKEFEGRRTRKYCSNQCSAAAKRAKDREIYHRNHGGATPRLESICWDCVHTGCSWIRDHKPVEGSEHIEKVVYNKNNPNGKETLFVMTICPQFLQEKRGAR